MGQLPVGTVLFCHHCGTEIGPYPGKGRPLSRCEACHRIQNSRFQREHRARKRAAEGPRPKREQSRSRGYRGLYLPGHPMAGKNGYALEHRVVMSEIVGRPLHRDEQVHHKNGRKWDNRPENLELFSTSHPAGQRPHELVAWAKEILQRYVEHGTL